jgi:mono/diheme cytochrome c family protein
LVARAKPGGSGYSRLEKEIIMASFLKGSASAAALSLLAVAPRAAPAEADKKTERLWKAKCASCHGADGKAQTPQGKELGVADYTTPEWQKARDDAQIKKAILDGVKLVRNGKSLEMSGYKDQLSPEQAEQLVAHIRALAK